MNKPTPRNYQVQAINQTREALRRGIKNVLLVLATGGGKCLAYGTKVLLADGSVQEVQNLKPNDLLMGADSTPRNIKSICTGSETMYEIIPIKGESWTCNESHILSLVYSDSGEILNISVKDYLQLSKTKKHLLKLYRTGVDFDTKPVPLNPYFLGLWLGDGHSASNRITNCEPEIAEFLMNFAAENNLKYTARKDKRSNAITHSVARRKGGNNLNLFSIGKLLAEMDLKNNKHIPFEYLTNSREIRLQVLAGLLDTDGYLHHNHYEIATVFKPLADDILYLCRSLGLAAYCKEKPNMKRQTWRITISGNVSEIPCKVERRKASERMQVKDVLRTGFKLVNKGIGQYYGFELEGADRLFLLGDFTVSHNTTIAAEMILAAVMKEKKVLFVAHRRELILQAQARLLQYGVSSGVIMGAKHKYKGDSVNVASIQTLVNREFPEADLVYFDEAHHCVLEGSKPPKQAGLHSWQQTAPEEKAKDSYFKKVFDHYNQKAVIVGLTATPWRLDGKPLGNVFEEIVVPEINGETVDIGWLQREGYLVECRYFGAPIEPDLSDLKATSSGDFSQVKLAEKFDKKELYEGVVENYLKYGQNKKAIVFCTDIPGSKKTMAEFEAHGIKAGHLDSYLNEQERESVLYAFKSGMIDVLLNVGILTEGYDLPDIEMMIAFRGTASVSLWLQMIGRALRAVYAKGFDTSTKEGRLAAIAASHKPYAIVLDHGTNCRRLGFAEDVRECSLELSNKKKKGVSPIKECKEANGGCGALVAVSSRICLHCGFEFDVKAEAKELKKVDFIELKPTREMLPDHLKKPIWQLSLKELEEFRSFMKYAIGWVERELKHRAKGDMKKFEAILREYADIETPKKKKYSESWISKNLEKMAYEV